MSAAVANPAPVIAPAPLNVLLVVDSLGAGGGAERYVSDLATALSARGHAVTVACSVDGPLRTELEHAGVEVLALLDRLVKRRVSLRFAAALRRVIRQNRPDIVHAHIYASAAAAALATIATDVPLMLTEHTEAPWRSRRAVLVSRWIYHRAARIHGVSQAIETLLLDRYSLPRTRVQHVPTAVHALASECFAGLPPRCRDRRLIARVARLAPEKGIDVFLHTAAHVAPQVPDAHFLIVGDGPQRPMLEASVRRLGIEHRVTFLGYRPDARAIISQLELLLVSSLSDGTPLVVLEAQHAGVPVIATTVGGLPDQIRHDHDGLLVAPADSGALAAATLALLADPDRAQRLAGNARRRLEAWTHDRLVERVEDAYYDLLGGPALSHAASTEET